MIEFETVADIHAYVGHSLGSSPWLMVTQDVINLFAQATGDHQWIHTDVERAAREMPDGKTIAHGYFTLAMLPQLATRIYAIRQNNRRTNYGSDKVRFTAPVQSGAEIRLVLTLVNAERFDQNVHRFRFSNVIEIKGREKPALVAETLMLVHA